MKYFLKEKANKEFIFLTCGNIPHGNLNKLKNNFFLFKSSLDYLKFLYFKTNPNSKVLTF